MVITEVTIQAINVALVKIQKEIEALKQQVNELEKK